MKRGVWIGIGAAAVLAVGAAVWYKIPVEKTWTVSVCEDKPGAEPFTAAFDIRVQRYFFQKDRCSGTLDIEGKERFYLNWQVRQSDYVYTQGLNGKLSSIGQWYYLLMGYHSQESMDKSGEMVIVELEKGFSRVVIYNTSGDGRAAAGPAESPEEARRVIEEVYPNINDVDLSPSAGTTTE